MNSGLGLCLTFGIGFVAGLRSMTAPAVVAWAAHLGWINLSGTPLAFMGSIWAVALFTLGALGEYVADTTPQHTRTYRSCRAGCANCHGPADGSMPRRRGWHVPLARSHRWRNWRAGRNLRRILCPDRPGARAEGSRYCRCHPRRPGRYWAWPAVRFAVLKLCTR